MSKEIEAKLRIESIDKIRTALLEFGAADEGEVLERNWVLDTPDEKLKKRDILLRLRSHGDPGGIFTVKRKAEDGEFKIREEVETMVDSSDDFLRQFEMLGFEIVWIYEKRRRTMLWRDCVIALDLCPEIGSFIEVEGQPAKIRDVLLELGLDADSHIDDSYLGLWQRHLARTGSAPRYMVFA